MWKRRTSSNDAHDLRLSRDRDRKHKGVWTASPSDMPMMSDDRWQRLANEQVVKNYTREHGHAPESLEAAYAWQEEWIAETEAI